MVLQGTEIKAIRLGLVNMTDAYCVFQGDEFVIKALHISEYKYGTINNHEPTRDRKLLLTKGELKKIKKRMTEKGLTVVPIRIFISERGFAKVEIGLAKGKNYYDKRHSIKEKDSKRELDRIKKLHD